jgi:hypothetical protein
VEGSDLSGKVTWIVVPLTAIISVQVRIGERSLWGVVMVDGLENATILVIDV